MKLKTKLILILSIILVIGLFNTISDIYSSGINLYNTTVSYRLEYQRKDQELVTFFDAKYLAFTQKFNLATINKDAFILVTTIIMNGRKDGKQLAWKWLQENQPIPYDQFTQFYYDLSAFVDDQYGGMFEIEKQKQLIVNEYNRLIVIYPNNILNSFLHIPPLQYRYGLLSENTRRLFNL